MQVNAGKHFLEESFCASTCWASKSAVNIYLTRGRGLYLDLSGEDCSPLGLVWVWLGGRWLGRRETLGTERCWFLPRGMFVKIRDKQRHPECYVCSDCGTNLKQKGHFFVGDQIYCEKHARERVTPPEGYEVVTVFPK